VKTAPHNFDLFEEERVGPGTKSVPLETGGRSFGHLAASSVKLSSLKRTESQIFLR
jgi:hypothetical protein